MRRLGQNRAGTHAGGGNPPDAAVWRGTQTDPDPGVTISVRYRLRPVRRLALVAPGAPLSSLMATPEHSSSYLPFQQFQALFNSLFKVLCIFPSRYLFAIGLSLVFSLRRNLPPILSCSPKQPDSSRTLRTPSAPATNGTVTLHGSPVPRDLCRRSGWMRLYRLQFGDAERPDFHFELFPLHSPLLGESLLVSFPPLNYMLKSSGSSCLISGPKVCSGGCAQPGGAAQRSGGTTVLLSKRRH